MRSKEQNEKDASDVIKLINLDYNYKFSQRLSPDQWKHLIESEEYIAKFGKDSDFDWEVALR